MNKLAIYPGTFDPVTYGHLDIIVRALKVVDNLVVAVAIDNTKTPSFSPGERVDMIEYEIKSLGLESKVTVECFEGLLVNFVQAKNSSIIIRGLRAVSDFEYEFQMACMNSQLAPQIETIFLPASEKTHFISSRLVKEVARLKGDPLNFVSKHVTQKLKDHFGQS
jgi:pantetheine-phosphate adenylyltransferase